MRGLTKINFKTPSQKPSLVRSIDQYHKVIQDQIEAGIIEEVKPHLKESIPSKEPCRTYHISHHGVAALTTKLGVVFDESAKVKPDAPSLNECLHTGPSLLSTIIDILLRFRYRRVALVADIEKAFHISEFLNRIKIH